MGTYSLELVFLHVSCGSLSLGCVFGIIVDAQPYHICFSWGRLPGTPLPSQAKGFVLPCPPPSSIHLCRVCQRASPPSSIPFPRILSPSQASQRSSCCFRGASSPPPPGWVQGPDFHLNSRHSVEASPPPRRANKEPSVPGWDVQPALTSPLSSMRLFSPCAGARGAGLLGDRLPALGSMPLILSSPSLFPLLPLWSSRGLFGLQLVFVRHRGNKMSQTGLVAGDGMR